MEKNKFVIVVTVGKSRLFFNEQNGMCYIDISLATIYERKKDAENQVKNGTGCSKGVVIAYKEAQLFSISLLSKRV